MWKELHSTVNFLIYVLTRGQKARRFRWFDVACDFHRTKREGLCPCMNVTQLELFKAFYIDYLARLLEEDWYDPKYYCYLTMTNHTVSKAMRTAALKSGIDPSQIIRHSPYKIHISLNPGIVTASFCVTDRKRTLLYDDVYSPHIWHYTGCQVIQTHFTHYTFFTLHICFLG